MARHESIEPILKRVPRKPGVYQFFDEEGAILYVGKAKNLKNRVSSYFNKQKYENGKTCLLYTSPSPRDRTRSRMPSSA